MNLNTKGQVRIVATDELTGKQREVVQSNIVVGLNTYINSIYSSSLASFTRIHLAHSPFKVAKNIGSMGRMYITSLESSKVSSSFQDIVNIPQTTPYEVEQTFRFASTGSPVNINVLALTDATAVNNYGQVLAYVALDSTFVQGASEALDITYKLQFNTVFTNLNQISSQKHLLKTFFNDSSTIDKFSSTFIPQNIDPVKLKEFRSFPPSHYLTSSSYPNSYDISVASGIRAFKNMGKLDYVGVKISNFGLVSQTTERPLMSVQSVEADGFKAPNAPLNPLFNSGHTTSSWCEDVGDLASGTKIPTISPNATPSNITYVAKMAKTDLNFFRVTKTGDANTARFDYSIRPIGLGLSRAGGTPYSSYNYTTSDYYRTKFNTVSSNGVIHTSMGDGSVVYSSNIVKTFIYNSSKIINIGDGDSGAIALVISDLHDITYFKGFDKSTATSLPASGSSGLTRTGICRTLGGDLFYVSDSGIVKITDPLGSSSVSTITNATIGNTGNDTIRFIIGSSGVTESVYLVTASNIYVTHDGGTTWATHAVSVPTSTVYGASGQFTNTTLFLSSGIYSQWVDLLTDTLYTFTYDPDVGKNSDDILVPPMEFAPSYWNYMSNEASNMTLIGKEFDTTYYSANNLHSNNYPYTPVITKDSLGNMVIRSNDKSYTLEGYTMKISNSIRRHTSVFGYLYDEHDYGYIQPTIFMDLYNNSTKENSTSPTAFPVCPNRKGIRSLHKEVYGDVDYRWDNANSVWKENWNADAVQTGDGSAGVTAKRVNFNTDENRFNGCCYLNASASLAGQTLTSGLTLMFTVNTEPKTLPAFSSTWKFKDVIECPTSCIFELKSTTDNKSVALMKVGDNNQTQLYDRSTAAITDANIENNIGDSSTHRYVATISGDGTTVNIFRDGTNISTTTLTSALDLTHTFELTIGMRNKADKQEGVPNYGSGLKGEISNIQIYNNIVSNADITTDAGNVTGLVSSTNLLSRYLMTTDYQEGKVCTTAPISVPKGIDISFPTNATGDSYIEGDVYKCVKVSEGFVKDNASTFDWSNTYYNYLSSMNVVTSPISGTNVIPASGSTTTEPALFMPYTVNESNGNIGGYGSYGYYRSASSSTSYVYTAVQTSNANIETEFVLGYEDAIATVGIIKKSQITTNNLGSGFKATFDDIAGNIELQGFDNVVENINDSFAIGSKFKMTWDRTNGIGKLFKWNGSAYIQLGTDKTMTDTNVSSDDVCVSFYGNYTGNATGAIGAFTGVTVTYPAIAGVMRVGDKTTETGVYDKAQFQTSKAGSDDSDYWNGIIVSADGVPLTKTVLNTKGSRASTNLQYPRAISSGECVIFPSYGTIMCSDADAGKTITINKFPILLSGAVPSA